MDGSDGGHWYPFEGHRIWYRREGSGQPLVFLPNANLTWRLWERQVPYFARDYEVIAVDLPGFGRSRMPGVAPSLKLYVRWLEGFVADLGLAPVVLVGNCAGSLTALHYAARRSDAVAALALIHTLTRDVYLAGCTGPLTRAAVAISKRPLLRRPARAYMAHMPAARQRRMLYVDGQFGPIGDETGDAYLKHARRCLGEPETRLAMLSFAPDVENWLLPVASQLAHRPALCWIWGEANRLLPLEVGRAQLEVVERDEVHILERCGDAAAWERPDEVNEIIEAFLRRHVAARAGVAAVAEV